MADDQEAIQLLSIQDLTRLTSCSRSTIYCWIQAGDFPKPVPIGARGVRWPVTVYNDWLAGQIAAAADTAS